MLNSFLLLTLCLNARADTRPPTVPLDTVPNPVRIVPEDPPAGDAFLLRWVQADKAATDEFEPIKRQLRDSSLPECSGKTTLTACFSAWLEKNPPTSANLLATQMKMAETVVLVDKKSKSTEAPAEMLGLTELLLTILESTKPEKLAIHAFPASGSLEEGKKKVALENELRLIRKGRDRVISVGPKLLEKFESKASKAQKASAKERIASIAARIEAMKKRNFTAP